MGMKTCRCYVYTAHNSNLTDNIDRLAKIAVAYPEKKSSVNTTNAEVKKTNGQQPKGRSVFQTILQWLRRFLTF
jgi:hypothetical protein